MICLIELFFFAPSQLMKNRDAAAAKREDIRVNGKATVDSDDSDEDPDKPPPPIKVKNKCAFQIFFFY